MLSYQIQKFFFRIAASVADAADVKLNDIKTLLANGLSRLFIKGKADFRNGPRSIHANPPVVLFDANEFLLILY